MPYSGPWPLTHESSDNVVKEVGPGTYFVGRIEMQRGRGGKDEEKFIHAKVGRDGVNLNEALHWYVGSRKFGKWRYFMFRYWPTPRAAFEEEARVFHTSPGPKNETHPVRPFGLDIPCPVGQACFANRAEGER
jgi:hypothetical protein